MLLCAGVPENEEDADASLMEDIAEAEAAYEAPDSDFAAASEFPIEPFSLREEWEVRRCPAPENILHRHAVHVWTEVGCCRAAFA